MSFFFGIAQATPAYSQQEGETKVQVMTDIVSAASTAETFCLQTNCSI